MENLKEQETVLVQQLRQIKEAVVTLANSKTSIEDALNRLNDTREPENPDKTIRNDYNENCLLSCFEHHIANFNELNIELKYLIVKLNKLF